MTIRIDFYLIWFFMDGRFAARLSGIHFPSTVNWRCKRFGGLAFGFDETRSGQMPKNTKPKLQVRFVYFSFY